MLLSRDLKFLLCKTEKFLYSISLLRGVIPEGFVNLPSRSMFNKSYPHFVWTGIVLKQVLKLQTS